MGVWGTKFGKWSIVIVSLCLAIVGGQTQSARDTENGLLAVTAQLQKSAASQNVHIVEVDADSIATIHQFPWPREHYAALVRQLDAAGARSIVFDIEFSTPSAFEGDVAFAEAMAQANASIVMPTFSQSASEQSERQLDTLPIPAFRESTTLASASVKPDADARLRRMFYGTITDGTPRPSLSAQIAGARGAVGTHFPIDFSIDPSTIPRHSFTDIENGNFDSSAIAGKDVLVGATAIQLGDRYGVPIHGVIPGVTIHALAAETLIAGGLNEQGWIPLLLGSILFALLVIGAKSYRRLTLTIVGGFLTLFVVQAVAYHGAATILEIVPALIILTITGTAQIIRIARAELRAKSQIDGESSLPNAFAFARTGKANAQFVGTAFIKDFDSIQTVLGKDKSGSFIRRLAERLQSSAGISTIFRADARILAWTHSDLQALTEQFTAIEKALRKPIDITGRRIDVSLAFGVATDGDLAAASRAAGQAAKTGKVWHAHEDAEATLIEQRISLMGELDEAITSGQIAVHYQPKLRLSTNQIESVEALVRWQHPTRGNLSPDTFIPLAEETNRIELLTLFVLQQTIKDLREWSDNDVAISAAVNISATLISSESFVTAAERTLCETGVPRDRLIFEITESATMHNPDLAARNLMRFRDLGVEVSMDDYGTGQSTLSYLQLLPLTELKIDRTFVQNAHVEKSDALLVRSTIQLAHSLGLRVVGEGVEEEECLAFRREVECDYAQGYFVSKPLKTDELVPLVKSRDPAQKDTTIAEAR